MDVPVETCKVEGMEILVFYFETSPHDRETLSGHYYSGYQEIQLVYTKDHPFVNPSTFRFLFLRPITSTEPRFEADGEVLVFTIRGEFMNIGFVHDAQPDMCIGGVKGADLLTIRSFEGEDDRTETFAIRHSKGILVPHYMECS
jgi:hypothetical protein